MTGLLQRLHKEEKGQSLVELALVLPFLLLILLGIIQFGFVLSGQITVTSAAREGARLAATGATDATVRERVLEMIESSPMLNDPEVLIDPEGNRVFGEGITVRVEAASPLIVPLPVEPAGGIFNLASEAVMRVEHVAGGH